MLTQARWRTRTPEVVWDREEEWGLGKHIPGNLDHRVRGPGPRERIGAIQWHLIHSVLRAMCLGARARGPRPPRTCDGFAFGPEVSEDGLGDASKEVTWSDLCVSIVWASG